MVDGEEGKMNNFDRFDGTDDEGSLASRKGSPRANEEQENRRTTVPSESDGTSRSTSDLSPDTSAGIHSPGSPFSVAGPRTQSSISVASLLRQPALEAISSNLPEHTQLTQEEARLVHYYSEHLGRWLDCTDATRQFTLGVPEKVRHCPVLCHSVLSFAARHRREDVIANAAYQRCIELLIQRLNEPSASHDETLLCAIVILQFFEQLNGRSRILSTGTSLPLQYRPRPVQTLDSTLQVPPQYCVLLKEIITLIHQHPHFVKQHFGSMSVNAFTQQPSISNRQI